MGCNGVFLGIDPDSHQAHCQGTRDLKLTSSMSTDRIIGYTDTDHASQYHRHSILGYTFLINGGMVSWSSKKQPLMALLTTEAEYIVDTHTMKEALWL